MSLTALSAWLLTYWMHSTVLLAAAAIGTRWLVRTDAWRETLWKTALLGGLVTASAQAWSGAEPLSGRWELVTAAPAAVSPAEPEAEPAAIPPQRETKVSTPMPPTPAVTRASTAERGAAGPRTSIPWMTVLLGAWAAGALLMVIRLGGRHRRLGRLLADRRRVVEPGLGVLLAELRGRARMWRRIRLSASSRCATPLALGVREICLPERLLADLGPEEQRGALAHEVAHLARNDPAWQLAAALLESIFLFQPLNRVARRRLRDTAEHLCDGQVAVRDPTFRPRLPRPRTEPSGDDAGNSRSP